MGLYSPVRTSTFTLNDMEDHVPYFNKLILAAG